MREEKKNAKSVSKSKRKIVFDVEDDWKCDYAKDDFLQNKV